MKQRIKATHMVLQLNRKPNWCSPGDDGRTIYSKAYHPDHFAKTIRQSSSYMTYTLVAIWRIKYKPTKK